MKSIVAIASVFLLVSLVGCGASVPSEADGRLAILDQINKSSDGRIKVVNFHKTNGIEVEGGGSKTYRMEYEVEIEFTKDWSPEDVRLGYPTTTDILLIGMKQAKRGDRRTVHRESLFEKTENGWRLKD